MSNLFGLVEQRLAGKDWTTVEVWQQAIKAQREWTMRDVMAWLKQETEHAWNDPFYEGQRLQAIIEDHMRELNIEVEE